MHKHTTRDDETSPTDYYPTTERRKGVGERKNDRSIGCLLHGLYDE